jgi:peptidoglycan hydrolase-like protein with peptidoglycan-binding domain
MVLKTRRHATRRMRWATLVVCGSVLAVCGSFVLGAYVKSPWEAAVANSEVEPLVTLPVEDRVLAAETFEAKGSYSAGMELSIAIPPGVEVGVVTAQKLVAGDDVQSGAVLVEVSGRPILALATPFRLYRDLVSGVEGPDVIAVQEALRDLGHYDGAIDGIYGRNTASAVEEWYHSAGYVAPVDRDLIDAVEDARAALGKARAAEEDPSPDETSTQQSGLETAADDAEIIEVSAGVDVTAGTEADPTLDTEGSVREAEEALAKAEFAALSPLRAVEVAVVPRAGATVLWAAPVGSEPTGAADPTFGEQGVGSEVVLLRAGEASLTARVGVAHRAAFESGAKVEVRSVSDQQRTALGVVTGVSEFRQPDAETSGGLPGYDVTIVFETGTSFEDGESLIAVSLVELAPRASGLAVPLVALREDGRGTFVRTTERSRVPVEVIATGDGYAIVEAEELTATDDVVISGLSVANSKEGGASE